MISYTLYHEFKIMLINLFSLSLKTGVFPEKMKIAQVSQIFKKGGKSIITNYKPVSSKQFGFRVGHSIENAFLELNDQISVSLNDKSYFLGISSIYRKFLILRIIKFY